jgi:hypothetical protein
MIHERRKKKKRKKRKKERPSCCCLKKKRKKKRKKKVLLVAWREKKRRKKNERNPVYLGLYYFGVVFEFLLRCWFGIGGCKMGGLHNVWPKLNSLFPYGYIV